MRTKWLPPSMGSPPESAAGPATPASTPILHGPSYRTTCLDCASRGLVIEAQTFPPVRQRESASAIH